MLAHRPRKLSVLPWLPQGSIPTGAMLLWIGPIPVQHAKLFLGHAFSGMRHQRWSLNKTSVFRDGLPLEGEEKRESPGYFTSFSPFFLPICLGEPEGQS